MVNIPFKPGERDADWLRFDGTASLANSIWALRPSDMGVTIEMEMDDVYAVELGNKYVFVRRGSQYKALRADPGFDFSSIEVTPSRASSSCPKGSGCFGGVEYCCGSNAAVNNCYGRWKCKGD
jgi:hypothetical protein